MELFEIFYNDNSFDGAGPLPARPAKNTRYAVCVNGAPQYFIRGRSGAWVRATKDVALARKLAARAAQ